MDGAECYKILITWLVPLETCPASFRTFQKSPHKYKFKCDWKGLVKNNKIFTFFLSLSCFSMGPKTSIIRKYALTTVITLKMTRVLGTLSRSQGRRPTYILCHNVTLLFLFSSLCFSWFTAQPSDFVFHTDF